MTSTLPTYTLNDGNRLPVIGFGTYPLTGEDGTTAIVNALEAGYLMLDTAVNYENEREVGEAIRRSGLPRDEVVVASKIPGRHHAYDDAIASVRGSLDQLGLDYLDLHFIHWPNPSVDKFHETWRPWWTCARKAWSAPSASRTSPRTTSAGSSTTRESPRR